MPLAITNASMLSSVLFKEGPRGKLLVFFKFKKFPKGVEMHLIPFQVATNLKCMVRSRWGEG